MWNRAWIVMVLMVLAGGMAAHGGVDEKERRLLYVAVPGVRNYVEHGGQGIVVFDIDDGHKFVKRILTDEGGAEAKAVKGVCANARTKRLYYSTPRDLTCVDLVSEKVLWRRAYEGGCDRMSMSPDGKVMYLPTFEGDFWHVIDTGDGKEIARIVPRSGAHNTVYGADGTRAYLAGLRSSLLTVADTRDHTIVKTVGPFTASVRPFTVNRDQTLCFVNINELLGFEIGDIRTGKALHRVEVEGFKKGPVKRHGCPSHGIGLSPDEKEIWVMDAFNRRAHVFDATMMPPRQMASIELSDEPGWVTFSIDGKFAYPSTGDVIDRATRKIVAKLRDEKGRDVQSEKMLEIDFVKAEPVRAGDQFGTTKDH